jgi:SAM-dependent methyltransferase
MTTLQQALSNLSGGRLLDVATGRGNFIGTLIENLRDYSEITGIDANAETLQTARDNFKQGNVRFVEMDAAHLEFPDASFDTVCISNSLHHLANLTETLSEMERVLKPDGHFIVSEMYRDHQTETQLTHVYLHHWWAAVDSINGIVHYETWPRQEILDLLARLGLSNLKVYDLSDLTDDARQPEILAELNPIIDRYIQRAESQPKLQTRGEELRQRVRDIGFHSATTLLAIGQKSG